MTDTPAFAEVLSRAIPADGTTLDAMRAALWDTPAGRTMINKGDVVLYWLNEADVARAALAAAPQPMGCGLPCGYDCNGACFDAAAPQPAPVDREALVEALRPYVGAEMATAIATAPLARGLRLPGGEETMAYAVVDPVAGIRSAFVSLVAASRDSQEGDSIKPVAIRVVEGGDDE